MGIFLETQTLLMKLVDCFYAGIPRAYPSREKLKGCKIVSHRGEHDNRVVLENTLPAFNRAKEAGVWGVEIDVRWTRDLHPVVFHDPDLKRLFKDKRKISDLTLSELKSSFNLVPSLETVIDTYVGRLHLMVELKKEIYTDPVYQSEVLQKLFSDLEPRVHFHFLSLSPELFKMIEFVPPNTFLPIAEMNVASIRALSMRENYGGLLGHYLFLTDSILQNHRSLGQKIGTGFVNSKRCLFRELTRGVDWIFSDNAVYLQNICNTS